MAPQQLITSAAGPPAPPHTHAHTHQAAGGSLGVTEGQVSHQEPRLVTAVLSETTANWSEILLLFLFSPCPQTDSRKAKTESSCRSDLLGNGFKCRCEFFSHFELQGAFLSDEVVGANPNTPRCCCQFARLSVFG